MIRAALLAFALQAAATVTDANGHHFRAPPQAALDAIVDGALADTLFPGDDGQRATVGTLIVFAAHESGFQISPRGSNDHGQACGPFQRHASGEACLRLRRDWAYAVKVALQDFRTSMAVNPSHPWAAYCGSGQAAIRISDARVAEVKSLMVTP